MAALSNPMYRSILSDQHYPALARRFLAYALLMSPNDPLEAAHQQLSAAWVCDDLAQPELATECRRLAAESFGKVRPFEDDERSLTQGAIFVDLLRRVGDFELAAAECKKLLACQHANSILRSVLEYQLRLITARDVAAHKVEECAPTGDQRS
jgi:hypothetical protein